MVDHVAERLLRLNTAPPQQPRELNDNTERPTWAA